MLDEAGALFEAFGEREWLVLVRISQGMALSYLGRSEESTTAARDALAQSREIGYHFGISSAACNLGLELMFSGDTASAYRLMRESADVARAAGNLWGQSLSLANLGNFELRAGHLETAEQHFLEAHELSVAVGSMREAPIGLSDLAELAIRKGEPEIARQRIREGLTAEERRGDIFLRGYLLQVFAEIERSTGNLGEAAGGIRRSLEIWREFDNQQAYADCLDILADIAISAGDMDMAARMIGAADGIREAGNTSRVDHSPAQHERRIASLSGALGERGYREAWEAGRAAPLDETLAEAVAWRPPPGTSLQMQDAATPESVAGLSPRELEVLRLMTDGLTNQQIADRLFVSTRTAAAHVSNILARLELPSRTAAVAWALRNGID